MYRAVDIIAKKRDNNKLTQTEIEFLIKGYCSGEIPDYQTSAFLMAVYFNGMDFEETAQLTKAMINSGRKIDLSLIKNTKVDKHSTGGVGDKVSLLLAPIVASLGCAVPMMSGRGLGHTGGTIDKLESINGYNVMQSDESVAKIIQKCGYAMFSQTSDIVPADKKLYALRDVTSTVESIPLITASILSKKVAEGTQALVMDIKCGSGAFMKDYKSAKMLADSINDTGKKLDIKISSLITNMDEPLGRTIGNFNEVKEVVNILKYGYDNTDSLSSDLVEVTIELATIMLDFGEICSNKTDAKKLILQNINNGKAYDSFVENIMLQNGDITALDKNIECKYISDIKSDKNGYISKIDAYNFGVASMILGAGRKTLDDKIDHHCGIELFKKVGDFVKKDETIVRLFYNKKENFLPAEELCNNGLTLSKDKVEKTRTILDEIR